jgi:molybdate transport system substrate-binding protein
MNTPALTALAATLAFTLGILPMTTAHSAELKILAGGGIAGPLKELGPQFEQASGHKVVVVYDATPGLIKRTQSEPFDLGLAPREVFADAAAKAKFAAGSPAEIARPSLTSAPPRHSRRRCSRRNRSRFCRRAPPAHR